MVIDIGHMRLIIDYRMLNNIDTKTNCGDSPWNGQM